ncbi:MAG: CDGSH iron-sulfur domain-containing protein [Prolixibacteraceae bacterium]|jgi:CDGSH iron-sulfur domain-containing protein 3|nr:CDGSH iron-sulfur domain-containing protein [Prolixibacteraceae bacterium]MBT6764112.1 CDGSH iron-sulfur domain-containing protein [Prolixibacteraceae bacterium]MBT6999585.1 CDGSH iron-sulfur domain-containing protein [Prolixibacteraceae bacterium]MBT7393976.1 CDGSH iron-sulfur domain-containing protein [Prolixibacteraceae bacterium]
MEKPKIVAKSPVVVNLEAGTHYWCSCGKSKNQPFCDGSHGSSEFLPLAFKIDEKKDVWLCQCKHSKNPPFCDGTHKEL